MTLICVLYILIGIKLKNSKTLQGITRDSSEINRSISSQTRIIRMLSKFQIGHSCPESGTLWIMLLVVSVAVVIIIIVIVFAVDVSILFNSFLKEIMILGFFFENSTKTEN